MSSSRRRPRLAQAGIALLLASGCGAGALAEAVADALAGAEPVPGWTRSDAAGLAIYRPDGEPNVELRIHPREAAASLDAWFAARTRRAPDGVAGFSPGRVDASRPDVRVAAGLGDVAGRKLVVVVMGCQAKNGDVQYAELRLPPDGALVQRHAEPASNILAQACLQETARGGTAVAATVPGARPDATPPAPVSASATSAASSPPASIAGALRNSDIHAVLYSWRQVYEVTGLQFYETTYLLLKDGTVRRNVPAQPPALFDVAADRRNGKAKWGRWRKSSGGYELEFGNGWDTPPGQLLREPAKPGERFDGTYQASSSASIGYSASAWANWGLVLTRDGRFRRWNTSGAGGQSGFGNDAVVTGTISTDKGSASSVSAPNVGGGSSTRTGVTDADLTGEYHVDGWTLELRYASGRVQRGFFYTDDDRRHVWFEGSDLMRDKRRD